MHHVTTPHCRPTHTRTKAILLMLWIAVGSCAADHTRTEFVIELKTDFVPEVDFLSIRTTVISEKDLQPVITDEQSITDTAHDFVSGVRIGEYDQLVPGDFVVKVALLDNKGKVLTERPTRMTLTDRRAMTVVISRDCRNVQCPSPEGDQTLEACWGGVCVDARCTPETLEYCDTQAFECATNAECASEHACVQTQCVENVCFSQGTSSECDSSQMCVPETGCTEVEPPAEPTCSDGKKNGNEIYIDCGGDCLCPVTEWVRGHGGPGHDNPSGVGIDSDGNIILAGTYSAPMDFGGGALTGTSLVQRIFLASFDRQGQHRWSKRIGDPARDSEVLSLNVDANDDIYVVGTIYADSFLVSYDKDGNQRWARDFVQIASVEDYQISVTGVATDQTGHVYITGSFSGIANFGSGSLLVSSFGDRLFVASYDTDSGAHRWSNTYSGDDWNTAYPSALVATDDGRHFITGYFNGELNLGGTTLSADIPTAFIAGFNSAGYPMWSVQPISTEYTSGAQLALNSSDDLLVAGYFTEDIDFGTGVLTSAGGSDVFIASYTTDNGQVQWSQRIGGTGSEGSTGMAVSTAGVAYIGTSDFATPDVLVIAHDANTGLFLSGSLYNETGISRGGLIAIDKQNAMYITGSFEGTFDFAGEELVDNGDSDIFLLKTLPP